MSFDARGSAAVEFALVLPLLLILLLGTVEFGNLFFQRLEISQAAMSGARAGITGSDKATAETIAKNVACASLPTAMQQQISTCGGAAGGSLIAAVDTAAAPQQLVVTISWPYQPIVGNALFNLAALNLKGITLQGKAALQF